MKLNIQIKRILMLCVVAFTISACGSTWDGVKSDASDNLQKTGDALNKAGKKIKTD